MVAKLMRYLRALAIGAIVLMAAPAHAQVVQVSNYCFITNATSWPCSFSTPTHAGTGIVAYYANRFGGGCTNTLSAGSYGWTDDAGDIITDDNSDGGSYGNAFGTIGYVLSGAGGATTVTYTHTGGSGVNCGLMVLYEISGLSTKDGSATLGNGNCTTALTTHNPQDVLLSYCYTNGATGTYTGTSGWTLGNSGSTSSAPGPWAGGAEWQLGSAATYTPSFGGTAVKYHGITIAFKLLSIKACTLGSMGAGPC